MKQIKLLLLLSAMLLPILASANPVEINGIWYNLNSKTKKAEVTRNNNRYSGEVVIPNKVTYKGKTYSVTSIGESTFSECYSLTSVTIPNSVTSIGKKAFYLSYLQSVTIGNSVATIEENAFGGSKLTSVTIPSSVTFIDSRAFCCCDELTSIKVEDGNAVYDSRNNCNAIIETGANKLIEGCQKTIIPKSVISIGEYAFYQCYSLTSITIPNSVTTIGKNAFMLCIGLTSINLPKSITAIDENAFHWCYNLTSITIPNSVTSIGAFAFAGCNSMASISIPNSVTSIGNGAFQNCSALTSVILPNSVTCIDCGTFGNCTSLKSVIIPSSVTTIVGSAFYGCSSLTSITIGSGVNSIGSLAFSECPKLSNVYCYAGNVPFAAPNVFDGSNVENAKLHVLKGRANAYAEQEPWKSFMKIVEVTAKVKLEKAKTIIQKGTTETLTATVYPSSLGDKSVTWTSSNTKVATVTSKGKVKGVKAGTATITCTSNVTGAKATCEVTVGYVKLDQTEAIIQKGKTVTLTATVYPSKLEDKSVTWSSSNTKIATVTSKGKVKGVKAGTATITCTSNATGLSTTCTVTVGYVKLDQTEVSVNKGKTVTLTATVYPSKLTDKSVTWESSNTKIATVTSTGKVKGIKAGTATITCTSVATGLSTSCTVTVTSGTRSIEGDDDELTGIDDIEEKSAIIEPFDVYDLSGRKVLNQVTSLDGLPKGIYIVNGKKVLKKQ